MDIHSIQHMPIIWQLESLTWLMHWWVRIHVGPWTYLNRYSMALETHLILLMVIWLTFEELGLRDSVFLSTSSVFCPDLCSQHSECSVAACAMISVHDHLTFCVDRTHGSINMWIWHSIAMDIWTMLTRVQLNWLTPFLYTFTRLARLR